MFSAVSPNWASNTAAVPEIVRARVSRRSKQLQQPNNCSLISTVHILWACPMPQCFSVTSHLIRVFFYQGLSRGESSGVQSLPPLSPTTFFILLFCVNINRCRDSFPLELNGGRVNNTCNLASQWNSSLMSCFFSVSYLYCYGYEYSYLM